MITSAYFLISQAGDIYWTKRCIPIDKMAAFFGLTEYDNKNKQQLLARVRFDPPCDNMLAPLADWKVVFDKQKLPHWLQHKSTKEKSGFVYYEEDLSLLEEQARVALKDWWDFHVHMNPIDLVITEGTHWFYGKGAVTLKGDSEGIAYNDICLLQCGTSAVDVFGNAHTELFDNSQARLFCKASALVRDYANVEVHHHSTAKLLNHSTAVVLDDGIAIQDDYSHSTLRSDDARADLYSSNSSVTVEKGIARLFRKAKGTVEGPRAVLIDMTHAELTCYVGGSVSKKIELE